ncbi:hypothetical protein AAFF_G00084530 [Aldrovandia affinis]|uniref:Uncharacterized protein n=1 Tax=Aldrovandia affinis TaxID=143900 RepID=A0AAD7RX28_9TELE|nr:hypothetical protein AAFF_G00084530 [Aldrovandia affinis]
MKLMQFTAKNLDTLLKCKLPSNMTYSKETWKLFLTKVSGVLNEALSIFSNMTFHITSPSTTDFLDILGEIRIDRFTDVQLADVDFINKWFHVYLRPFLSSVSGEFLHCLSAQNFSCETYHHVVKAFSYQFPHLDQMRQELVSKYFIIPFLSQNSSDPACISSTNGSVDWLYKNFGPFSVFVPLKHLLALNPDFVPLEALAVLSAKQMAELIVLRQTGPPQKDFIINTVFDHLLESPKERNLKEFLYYLIMFSKQTLISCDSYNIIIRRLDQALPVVPLDLQPVIRMSKNELMKIVPGDCIFGDLECSLTPHNETRICATVNRHLLALNPDFVPLEALAVLSAKQMAELIVLRQTGPPQKDFIINTVFDHLLESPKERNLKEFLYYLIMFSKETLISCDSYNIIIRRLDQALPVVPLDLEPVIRMSKNELMKIVPGDCIFGDLECSLTPHNETRICATVNSTELQHYLYTGNMTNMLCHFTIEQYACSELMQFTAKNLDTLLKCKLPSNMTYSKETWKLFLTKVSGVLNEALSIFSNMTFHITSPSTTHFLDILGEIRIDEFTDVQLADVDFINKWFHVYLRPFLSSVSGEFLHCLSAQNFSCETYHHVMKEFSYQFPHMDQMRQELVVKYFILPFLSQNSSDPACISSTNGSADWLHKNFGPFSVFVPLKILLTLNQDFAPLEALAVLSVKQMAELIVLRQTGPPEKELIINTVFDHLLEAPKERNLKEFLHYLVMFSTKENIGCDSYRSIFSRLSQALSLVPTELVFTITSSTEALMGITPQNCMKVIFSGECDVTPINETKICAGVNSTVLQHNIRNGSITEMLCSFSIEQYACALPIGLTASHLVTLLQCKLNSNVTSSKETWKLFITKVSGILDEALDMFSNMIASSSNPSTSHILDVIGEIRIDSFSATELRDMEFINQWFQTRLNPFLPSMSKEFLSCLSTKNFSCQTYQAVVEIFSHRYAELDRHRQMLVYTEFIDMFLSQNDTSDPGCISNIQGSADWLEKNFGKFVVFASFMDFKRLYMDFSAMDALSLLTLNQLAEVASTPEQLKNREDVNKLMAHVEANNLATFFDIVSPAVQDHESSFPPSVRSAMLQQVFDRGNLSDSSVRNAEILVWLRERLRPLLPNLSVNHVAPFFNIVRQRQCTTSQQAVDLLNSIHSTLHSDTQREVYSNILTSLKEPSPLQCYTNGSFYLFLEKSFRSFQFPNLTTFLSLMPQSQKSELINSIPPSDLSDFFMRPNVVDNDEELSTILNNYDNIRDFLETQEDIPDDVRRRILPCVWPLALSSENETEVDLWFERRLKLYLTFLTKDLISSTETQNARCLPFRKIVFVLGDNYSYNDADFTQEDVYNTIKAYLNTGTKPKCYNETDPQLNSKAWFVNYNGEFISYITLEDLNTFATAPQLQIFSTNLDNIRLFNHSSIPGNVSSYYTELIYLEDSSFNPLLLPIIFRCDAPGSAFSQLNANESIVVLHNLTQSCSVIEPEVSAALAGNFETISADTIAALGSESIGLTTGQITEISPSDIVSSLSTLSAVTGWNHGQLITIVQLLLKGNFAIASSASLLNLGSLVAGVPSNIITSIDSSEILNTSKDPGFIANILTAPQIVQQTYINKIITVNNEPAVILENVPDAMATEIPRTLLEFSPESVERINRKKWKYEQAVLFFGIVAVGFKDSNKISSAVLQGFTCTRVQTFESETIRNLIRASRRMGVNKVVLREPQLTCMYNSIKDFDPNGFQQYPPDILLYYNYETVRTRCKTYFVEIGAADFDILSLNEKKDALLDNAKSCLGITGTSINRTNVEILGNMCCTLDGSYIEASDTLILEKLKNCNDLSEVQVTSIEKVLLTGNTLYGDPSTWNIQTLQDLGILPLYLTNNIWRRFTNRDKRRFLKSFMKARRADKTEKKKLKNLFKESNRSLRSKRAVGSDCSIGSITQVVISDDAFPFGYDASQFNACLTATTVKNNLAALTEKVDDDDFQRIILDKLNQAYPTGIADEQVQVLGPVSRVASIDDINKWNVTKIDTLAALMASDDGPWEPDKSMAIVTKYLGQERAVSNSLGTAELNSIGGTNLCSLDESLLRGITSTSLRNANALTISNCSAEKKKVLFKIAESAFSESNNITLTTFQLIKVYLGGAPEEYIKRLTTSNVSMDVETFISLDENVINTLTVEDVSLLFGKNIPDLKTFENQTKIANWISRQFQSDLNTLNLQLIGGRLDPIPTGVGVINTTLTATGTGTGTGGATTTATDVTTTGNGGTSTKSANFLLAFTFIVLKILQ